MIRRGLKFVIGGSLSGFDFLLLPVREVVGPFVDLSPWSGLPERSPDGPGGGGGS